MIKRTAALGAAVIAALIAGGSSPLHAQPRPVGPVFPVPTAPPPSAQPTAAAPGAPAPAPGTATAAAPPGAAPAPASSSAPAAVPPPPAGSYPPPGGWQGGPPGSQPGPGYPAGPGYQGAPPGPGYPTGPGYPAGPGYQGAPPDPNLPGYADAWGWHPGCPSGCGPCKDFPGTMSYHEGQPIPPGYSLDSEPIWGLVIAGLVTTTTLWVFSAAIGLGLEDEEGHSEQSTPYYTREAVHYWPLALPIVGPFVTLGTGDAEGPAISMMVLDGILQTGGLVLVIAGAAAKRDVLVWNGQGAQVRAAPIVVANGAGMGVSGTF